MIPKDFLCFLCHILDYQSKLSQIVLQIRLILGISDGGKDRSLWSWRCCTYKQSSWIIVSNAENCFMLCWVSQNFLSGKTYLHHNSFYSRRLIFTIKNCLKKGCLVLKMITQIFNKNAVWMSPTDFYVFRCFENKILL